jgi:Leucine-rich repeat (LRR) protein
LTGGVPTALSVSVTHILVHRNMLTGEIPDLSGMPSLVWLSLYENGLSGEIPAELGNLADLQRLYLHGNMLTGMAPMELGNLVDLNNLLLMNNDLTGDIPTEWGALNLNRLWINNSGLTGCVPEGLVPTLTLVNSLGVETLPSDDITDSGLSVCTADDGS